MRPPLTGSQAGVRVLDNRVLTHTSDSYVVQNNIFPKLSKFCRHELDLRM